MSLVSITSKEEFKAHVLSSKKLVLVDFWAEWCPPCRMMTPILESLGKSMDAELAVVKVNVEESADNSQLAAEHGVQGIPNMQLYKDGTVVDELIGMRQKAVLENELRKHLAA
jgi:thioredoxin 1